MWHGELAAAKDTRASGALRSSRGLETLPARGLEEAARRPHFCHLSHCPSDLMTLNARSLPTTSLVKEELMERRQPQWVPAAPVGSGSPGGPPCAPSPPMGDPVAAAGAPPTALPAQTAAAALLSPHSAPGGQEGGSGHSASLQGLPVTGWDNRGGEVGCGW